MPTQSCCCEPAMPMPPSNWLQRIDAARRHANWMDTGYWIKGASQAVDRLHRWKMLRACMLRRAAKRNN